MAVLFCTTCRTCSTHRHRATNYLPPPSGFFIEEDSRIAWLLRCRRPRWLKRIYLSCLTALALFSAQLPAQLTPATNQQQDPVVTDVPSHARGVPSNQT